MVFLMAFLVVSTMDVVHVAAGRGLGEGSYGALIPGGTPSVPRGQPYTGRTCTKIYACKPPAAADADAAGGAP